ncbi:MAG: hypothetical protein ACRDZX_09285 [Acidimicrobiales bacterium]
MPKVTSTTKAALAGVVLTGALASTAFTGIAGAGAITPVHIHRRCSVPAKPGPGYNASIGNGQNGAIICLLQGEKLLVRLAAPAGTARRWHHVHVSPPGVLTRAPFTMPVPPNVMAQNFLAARPGTARLSSQRPACAPPRRGEMSCGAIASWSATVLVVRARKTVLPPPSPPWAPLLGRAAPASPST